MMPRGSESALARKFAVHRTAALFLDTLYKQFLADAKGFAPHPASEVSESLPRGIMSRYRPWMI